MAEERAAGHRRQCIDVGRVHGGGAVDVDLRPEIVDHNEEQVFQQHITRESQGGDSSDSPQDRQGGTGSGDLHKASKRFYWYTYLSKDR